jgi:YegS/Rv2252/BmrU family lipid kinase
MDTDAWYIIVNPAAGNGTAKRRWAQWSPQLLAALPSGTTVAFTHHRGHGIELTQQAIADGFRRIIAVGGDGTNHEITNGILSQSVCSSASITYALLPIGTGNDWIRTYGIPRRIDAWIKMLLQGHTRLQDVAHVLYHHNGHEQHRYGVNVIGLAYDAFIAHYSDRYKKWVFNGVIYMLMILRCLFAYKLVKLRVTFDGQTAEDYFYSINAGICKYSGGGMSLVPHAVPDDGLIALTLARRLTKLGVIFNTYRFYNDTIGQHPKIDTFQVRHIRVEAAGSTPTSVEADGEFLGETPVEISIVEGALKVVVPAE